MTTFPSGTKPIPFHRPYLEDDDIEAVVDTLRSGWLTTGPRVKLFEKEFAEYIGVKHALAVNSCTAAMHLALTGLGIRPGDMVITTPYTFVATAEAIQYAGAIPVFVDISERDFNIDPHKIQKLLQAWQTNHSGGQLRAILPVHIAGQPCDVLRLMQIAECNSLLLVEDAAHCLEGCITSTNKDDDHVIPAGSDLSGGRVLKKNQANPDEKFKIGALGDATCFSFYATKNLTTGEGGMVTTNSDDLAEKIRVLSLHGMSRDAWKRYRAEGDWYYEIVARGFKYNLPDILAALGLVQLRKLEKMYAIRRRYAQYLLNELAGIEELILPAESPGTTHAWHLFLVRLRTDLLNISRNEFMQKLAEKGVKTSVHFIPLHLQPYFQKTFGYRKGDFPAAEKVYNSVISLPFYPAMSEEELHYLADTVKELIVNFSTKRQYQCQSA